MRKTRSQTQAENALQSQTSASSTSLNNKSATRYAIGTSNNLNGQTVTLDSSIRSNGKSSQKRSQTSQRISESKAKEFEHMLGFLRIAELQKILLFLNISISGRKIDLQQRILNILPKNYEVISQKIKEVYSQFLQQQHIKTLDQPIMYSHMPMSAVQQNPGALGNSSVSQVTQQVPNNGSVNSVPFLHAIPTHIPIHPDVSLKKLAFYDVLSTLIKPSSLLPRNGQRMQEVPFYFTLTPQQAMEIASSRDIRNPNKTEYIVQVQLRFCLLETSCEQDDCFPPNVSVKVNNKTCQLPNAIPTNRPNVEPKRPPRPVNVTPNIKLSPTVTNTITVQWTPDYQRGYCLAVYLVQKLTSAQLLHRMRTKGIKPADYTRALIKEKLTEDADCEIATTMLKVSLNCPLGKMKMSIPCRASTCSHLQCFDASLFLQMNERKPTWNCPVCDKPAVYDNLVIDGYFQEVLASPLVKPDDTEIQLHKDGSWSTQSLRQDTQVIATPTKVVEKVEVIDDVDLVSEDAEAEPKQLTQLSNTTAQFQESQQLPSSTTGECVDLTLSDSEEDDDLPLAKRRPISNKSANSNIRILL